MPPRTRQARQAKKSLPTEGSNQNSSLDCTTSQTMVHGDNAMGQDIGNVTQPKKTLTAKGKRTSSAHEEGPGICANPPVLPNPTKRARNAGPAHGHPMQLNVIGEGEMGPGSQTSNNAGASKRELQRTHSFYPGYGGAASILDPEAERFLNSGFEDPPVENEEDWLDVQEMTVLTQGQPKKMAAAMANERPSWQDADGTVGVPRTASAPGPRILENPRRNIQASTQRDTDTATTLRVKTESVEPADVTATPLALDSVTIESPSTWPADTDLKLIKGSTRLMLTTQTPLVQAVIKKSLLYIRTSLLFENAFPDAVLALTFVRDAVISAAANHGPATTMHTRLVLEEDYISKIVPLPRARMSHFRGEVKECCNVLMFPVYMAMASKQDVAAFVDEQLAHYNYTFPKLPKHVGNGRLVMRSKPYRNDRIISVIRDMYFRGGRASFVSLYDYLFENTEDPEATTYEVPIPMVALVATALYATLYEWRSGDQRLAEFSANTYLDVYLGHVNTLRLVKQKKYGAFQAMMADIYSKASVRLEVQDVSPGAPVANLDISDLDE